MEQAVIAPTEALMSDTTSSSRIVTVFGGSGFIGRHVVRALARDGWRIRVATRRPDLAFHLQPLGKVGQIQAVQANVRFPESVAAAVRGADAVINLVGIQMQSGDQTFAATHVAGARAVAQAAKDAGIENFVMMSGIGVDENSESAYVRSRAEGEKATREFVPSAVILRPSIVFGPEDSFFNRFAALARFQLSLPLFGGGDAKFQPVYVGDVAKAVAKTISGEAKSGTTYELGGPKTWSFRELMQFTCDTIDRKRILAPLPMAVGRIAACTTTLLHKISLGIFPKWLVITRDQLEMLAQDNVVSSQAIAEGRTLEGLGIAPEAIESIVPSYLTRFRPMGQFQRQNAG
jgi:NADH dehydrogenase